ncbi:C-type lectin domain family 1 member A-like [Sphaerodactylus townsendi]|uniref:C-type lectin domain family 1 member A-like n=1 Tax=Sphaerodactylus townsendi TaxID=933632 RepID=UPI0020263E0D|nr:C-type lectin domain family 1 member A-like [Sphaerodactylus townsendi]
MGPAARPSPPLEVTASAERGRAQREKFPRAQPSQPWTEGTLKGTICPPDLDFRLRLKHFACNSLGNSTAEDVKDCKICPQDWLLHGSKCYWMSEEKKTWDKSQEFCKAKNSTLLMIQNSEEMTFPGNMTRMPTNFWLGLRTEHSEGPTWQWVDGSPLKKELWQQAWQGQGVPSGSPIRLLFQPAGAPTCEGAA